MRLSPQSLATLLTLLAPIALAAGCAPTDLGECDSRRARTTVFVDIPMAGDPDGRDPLGIVGLPMFEGQALLSGSCGTGLCHSSDAMLAARNGVPAGFSFDLRLACDARLTATDCADSQLGRLRAGRDLVYEHRFAIYDSVVAGTMPPPALDESVRSQSPDFRRADGTPLPELDSAEGRDILRNWLACRTPVIERAERITGVRRPGEYCGDGVHGDCVYGDAVRIDPPDPNWDSIYTKVVEPLCKACHSAGRTDYRVESQLDLSDADIAYTQIVGIRATGAFCKDRGLTHVVPSDVAGSFFLAKLRAGPQCGERMPLGGPYIPEPVLEKIAEWIAAGAVR